VSLKPLVMASRSERRRDKDLLRLLGRSPTRSAGLPEGLLCRREGLLRLRERLLGRLSGVRLRRPL